MVQDFERQKSGICDVQLPLDPFSEKPNAQWLRENFARMAGIAI